MSHRMMWFCALGLAACAGPDAGTLDPNARSQAPAQFRNPVTPSHAASSSEITNILAFYTGVGEETEADAGTPDPWIVWHNGHYYMSYTHFPNVIRRARTLAGLADAQEHVVWPPQDPTIEVPPDSVAANQLWAPEFFRLRSPEDGQFHWYWYTSPGPIEGKTMHVLESEGDDPLGPWHWKAKISSEVIDRGVALDGTVFENGDGRMYYLYSGWPVHPDSWIGQQLFIAEMDTPWSILGEPIRIARPTLPWELIGLPTNEGPEVLRRNGKLHVIFSASQCTTDFYQLGRLTVDETADLLDPLTWLTAKHPFPILTPDPEKNLYSTGHNGFFKSPDGSEDWIIYHAHTKPAGAVTGGGCAGIRTAHAQKVIWDADDNPTFPEHVGFAVDQAAPAGDPSYALQFEDAAPLEGQSSALAGDYRLVGEGGLEITAGPAVFDLATPPGTRQFVLRILAGPDRGRIALALREPGSGVVLELGVRDGYAPEEAPRALHFDAARLSAPRYELLIRAAGRSAASGGERILIDQLRLALPPD